MTSLLQIQLLGDFRLEVGGTLITALNADRPQSLLAYLLLHRQAPQPRPHIAFLMWPDSSEEQALNNLRNLLHKLRRVLPKADDFLAVDNLTVQWRPDAPFRLDVADFEAALAQARKATDCERAQQWLEQALASYGGDLLPGNYDDWLIALREELRQQKIEALHKLITLLEQQGEYRAALRFAQRLLQQDELDEAAYVLQMRLYALSGDRAGIRRVYQSCVDALARELDVEPSPATQAAYEQYLRAPSPITVAPLARGSTPIVTTDPVVPTPDANQNNLSVIDSVTPSLAPSSVVTPSLFRPRPLPAPRTNFLGRSHELAELSSRLADPACRLLTIIGPGGMGKTRLALETARSHQSIFADGVAFVSLAPLESVEQIHSAIADALNVSYQRDVSPSEQLLHVLREKELLLMLDNFEHLLVGAELLSTILDDTTRVKLLVTSRERLNLQEEWLFELGGLSVTAEPAVDGAESEAVSLFLQSARRVRQEFSPSPTDLKVIRQLCQLVGGLPLGIELAATWIRLLACREILDEVQRSLDFLSTSLRNLPERHRSLRAVFDHSWALLSDPEQRLFCRLSIFQGGFTRTAAEKVAGATLPLLAALVDKSLLQLSGTGRFTLHQLLHQYAQEKLTEAAEISELRNRHLRFFLNYVEETQLADEQQTLWLEQIATESENLWAALHWSTTGGDVESGMRLVYALHSYSERRGFWREEYEWLVRLLALPTAESTNLLRARLLLYTGQSALQLVDSTTAAAHYNTSLALARQLQSAPDIVMALIGLGDSQADHAAAQRLYEESLALSREIDFREGQAQAMTCLGHLYSGAGDFDQATKLYEEALAMLQELGDRVAATGLLRNLGTVAFARGAYMQARTLYEECLRVYRELDRRSGVMALLNDLADVALAYGETTQATQLYGESLVRANELGNKWSMAWNFESLGKVAVREEQYERAAYLFGCAERLFQAISARLRQDDIAEHERMLALCRAKLGAATFAAHHQQGHGASLEVAIKIALATDDSPKPVSI
ncbi:MAG: BTAD domain-containing putative transcriptional regulator [Caldilineaceae bacterium]